MPARKKTKKKSAKRVNKAAAKPGIKKSAAKKTVKTAARKKPAAKKAPAKKVSVKKAPRLAPGSMLITVEPALLERLKHLAGSMFKTLEEIIPQALGEFADHWEDHARTVEVLNSGSDRMTLVVPPEDEKTD
jgi:chemotaxis protein histidine kinase CheA